MHSRKISFAFILSLAALIPYFTTAQVAPGAIGYYNDALRFSQTRFGGTARFQGLAGANTALGGDASMGFSNPAGLAFMRRPEVSISLGVNSFNTSNQFLGETTTAGNLGININQLGLVLGSDRGSESTIRGTAFAVTYTRNNDFQTLINYRGVNNQNSIIDFFLERTDGIVPWSDLDNELRSGIFTLEGMAYSTYLINPFFGDNTTFNSYESFVPPSPIIQSERITRRGAQSVWNVSYSANVQDKVYIGASVGITSLRYIQDKVFREEAVPSGLPLNNLELVEQNNQDGLGVNVSGGIILRPNNAIRLGASITSPTFYRVTDRYSASLRVNYNNYPFVESQEGQPITRILRNESASIDPLQSIYSMRLPMRINGGAAFFLGKRGFITADVEYVDYTTARFSNPDQNFSFDADNRTIESLYKAAINLRVGAEMRIEQFRLRGGFAHYQDPFRNPGNVSNARNFITTGAGIRKQEFYLDGAVITNLFDSTYRLYNIASGAPTVETANTRISINFTAGFFF